MKQRKSEKGFTLIELVVGIGIAAVVVGAAAATIITMTRLSPSSTEWAVSLQQVQNAGYWISRDIQMSQGDITVGDGNPTFLTITQPTTPTTSATITYQFEDMSDGLKRLMRNDQVQSGLIAEYIYYDPAGDPDHSTRVISDQNPVTLQITATMGDSTVTRQYEAMQRVPASSP
jgi:prepilin-type N-terminal cleavage/methylation domain-containing protein